MKRNLFLFAALFVFTGSSFAQLKDGVQQHKAIKADHQKQTVIQKGFVSGENTRAAAIGFGVPVGLTNYDLQTNSNVAKRLVNLGGGKFTTAWTQYHGADLPGAPERGTGYNYNNGSSWQYTLFSGNTKVEGTQRTGWPAIVSVGGNDLIINHYNSAGGYFGWTQAQGTSNTGWTPANISAVQPLLWPRAVVSGNYIHVFGVVDNAVNYNGQMPAPVYIRSTDGGATWGSLVTLPGMDATSFASIGGDSYSIDANGSTVAIIANDLLKDFAMWKSTDNGTNWTKKIICDTPVDLYDWKGGTIIDEDNDLIADTVLSVVNADVAVDGNGVVHVVFASLTLLDADATDGAASYFSSYQNGIHYWNDNMAAGNYAGATAMAGPSNHELYMSPEVHTNVGFTPDLNNDNMYDLNGDGVADANDKAGSYGFGGWADFPSLAVTPNNELILTYSTVMEGTAYLKTNASPSAQNFRGIFMTKITPATGQTDPIDITTTDGAQAENIYCGLARNTDATTAYVQYMWDDEPGVNMRADNSVTDPVTDNYMLFKAVDFADLGAFTPWTVGVNTLAQLNITIFPNPAADYIKITNIKNSTVEIFNITGQKVMDFKNQNGEEINISKLAKGTYTVRVINNEGTTTKKIQKI